MKERVRIPDTATSVPGFNGEFELPEGVEDAIWRVRNGVIEASYPGGGKKICTIVFVPDRDRTASYGIGMTEKDCRPFE